MIYDFDSKKKSMDYFKPTKEEDYKKLDVYKIKRLFDMLRYDKEHRDVLIDHLFFESVRFRKEEEFKQLLKDLKLYDYMVNRVMESNDFHKIALLAVVYEPYLVDTYFDGEEKLVNLIHEKRHDNKPDPSCYEELMYYYLARIIQNEKTLQLMEEKMNESFDEETNRDYRFRIFVTKEIKIVYENLGRKKSEFRSKIGDIFIEDNIYYGKVKKKNRPKK